MTGVTLVHYNIIAFSNQSSSPNHLGNGILTHWYAASLYPRGKYVDGGPDGLCCLTSPACSEDALGWAADIFGDDDPGPEPGPETEANVMRDRWRAAVAVAVWCFMSITGWAGWRAAGDVCIYIYIPKENKRVPPLRHPQVRRTSSDADRSGLKIDKDSTIVRGVCAGREKGDGV